MTTTREQIENITKEIEAKTPAGGSVYVSVLAHTSGWLVNVEKLRRVEPPLLFVSVSGDSEAIKPRQIVKDIAPDGWTRLAATCFTWEGESTAIYRKP